MGAFFHGLPEIRQLLSRRKLMSARVGEVVVLMKELVNKKRLANAPTTIDNDKLRFVGIKALLQFAHFALAPYQFVHIIQSLKYAAKVRNIFHLEIKMSTKIHQKWVQKSTFGGFSCTKWGAIETPASLDYTFMRESASKNHTFMREYIRKRYTFMREWRRNAHLNVHFSRNFLQRNVRSREQKNVGISQIFSRNMYGISQFSLEV